MTESNGIEINVTGPTAEHLKSISVEGTKVWPTEEAVTPPPPVTPPPVVVEPEPGIVRPRPTVILRRTTDLKGALNSLRPGDVAFLEGGEWGLRSTRVDVTTPGRPDNPIQIYGAPGADVRLLGFVVLDAPFLTLGDLRLAGPTGPGTGTGLPYGEENQCWLKGGDCRLDRVQIDGNLYKSAVYIDSSRNQITRCFLDENGPWATPTQRQDGGVANNIDHAVYVAVGDDNVIVNNLIRRSLAFGIQLWKRPRRTVVAYNTMISNGQASNGGHMIVGEDVADSLIACNLMVDSAGQAINTYLVRGPNNRAVRNLSWRNRAGDFESGLLYGDNITGQDPRLDAEYRPLPGSPAIGHGRATIFNWTAPTVDRDGRPRKGRWDIGCYQAAS